MRGLAIVLALLAGLLVLWPGISVAIVDAPDALKAGLIADYTLSGHEGAYLAGVMAATIVLGSGR
jgi:basic membrane lipoprotein Med (substrate-binding protein (PBP1-ABC) superfamily)